MLENKKQYKTPGKKSCLPGRAYFLSGGFLLMATVLFIQQPSAAVIYKAYIKFNKKFVFPLDKLTGASYNFPPHSRLRLPR